MLVVKCINIYISFLSKINCNEEEKELPENEKNRQDDEVN